MKYTPYQSKVMNYVGLAKVSYKNMWNKFHQIGYVSPDKPLDKISIAKDFPNYDIKKIALLHECGHIYYNHTSVNVKEELKNIRKMFKEYNKDFMTIMAYGGPMNFLNIAMDLEVNSKLLTLANVKLFNSFIEICTPEAFNIPVLDNFREYYKYLIERLPEVKVEEMNVPFSSPMSGNMAGESGEGESDGSNGEKGDKGDSKSKDSKDGNDSDGNNQNGSGKNKKSKKSNGKGSSGDESGDGKSNGDNLPHLSKGLEDIANGVSGFDTDLDEDLQKALREENYESGEDKDNKGIGDEGNDESTVEEEVDRLTDEESGFVRKEGGNKGIGDHHGRGGRVDIVKNESKEIKKFLSQILKPNLIYLPDSFKHYNRGTRKNSDGLLYTSIRRRNRMDKKTLGILIDVSGSMKTESIIKALSSLKTSLDVVSDESVVVLWDVSKCGEYPIKQIPNSVESGGGTNLAPGIKYLVKEKKCTEIVVYSDMWTSLKPMTKIIKDNHIDAYTIEVVDGGDQNRICESDRDDDWKEYYKANKGYLVVKN